MDFYDEFTSLERWLRSVSYCTVQRDTWKVELLKESVSLFKLWNFCFLKEFKKVFLKESKWRFFYKFVSVTEVSI